MIWFISDTHFGHEKIIEHCKRPFAHAKEMDEALLANINLTVAKGDTLYHLGDFSFRSRFGASFYRSQIYCRNIHFIEGNHDKEARKSNAEWPFLSYNQLLEAELKQKICCNIVLCHYAMRTWHHKEAGNWQLYGHSHGQLPDDSLTLSLDVGVDTHNFLPYSLDELVEIMNKKKEKIDAANIENYGVFSGPKTWKA